MAGADMPADPPAPAATPGPPEPTTHLTWSKPIDGLRVRLIGSGPVVRVGEPFDLDFRLENCGRQMRPVLLPLVRRAILPAAEPAPPKQGASTGDLRITAEQISGDSTPPAPVQMLPPLPPFQTFPVSAGAQLWVTVTALPPGAALPGQAFKVIPRGRRANLNGPPMLHLIEYSSFPGLTRAGKYRITATFTAADPANYVNMTRLQLPGEASRNTWFGTIEAPPIELEVLPAEGESK